MGSLHIIWSFFNCLLITSEIQCACILDAIRQKDHITMAVKSKVLLWKIFLVQMQNMNKESEKKFPSDCQMATQSALPPTLC